MKNLHKSKKIAINPNIVMASLFVIALLGFILVKSSPTPVPIAINEIQNTGGNVEFTFSRSSLTLSPGQEESISLVMDSRGTKVTAAQVVLNFDPSVVSVTSVTQGSFLSNILTSPKVSGNQVSFAYAAAPDSEGVTGSGTIATLKLKAIKPGNATLSFVEGSAATAYQLIDKNVLKSASSLAITVSSSSTTTTPVASPKTKATASPIASSTTTYRAIPEPSATPAMKYTPAETEPNDSLGKYAYTQSELDKNFDPSQNLSFFERIIAFFKSLFNPAAK